MTIYNKYKYLFTRRDYGSTLFITFELRTTQLDNESEKIHW